MAPSRGGERTWLGGGGGAEVQAETGVSTDTGSRKAYVEGEHQVPAWAGLGQRPRPSPKRTQDDGGDKGKGQGGMLDRHPDAGGRHSKVRQRAIRC